MKNRSTPHVHIGQLMLSLLAVCAWSLAATAAPSPTEPTTTTQLQQQVDALNKNLAQLQTYTDPAARQQAMQQHWSMMQEHMRAARMRPGMDASGCADWMMMDSSMMGPGMMGQSGSARCGWMGHGTMGSGMMGPGHGW